MDVKRLCDCPIAFPGEVKSGSPSGIAQNDESGSVLCFRYSQSGCKHGTLQLEIEKCRPAITRLATQPALQE